MFKPLLIVLIPLFLWGCGGGGSGSGSGGNPGDPESPPVEPRRFVIERAFPDAPFDQPLAIAIAPGDAIHIYVAQQNGLIRSLDVSVSGAVAEDFLDLGDRTRASGEQGLLGLAFDPGYASNGFVYVYYSANANPDGNVGDSVIARFTADPATGIAAPGTEVELLRFAQPFNNHNGGALAFGPDGHLYIASGDGGSGNDPQNNAQNLGNLLGKILRITRDGGIPPDNPFVGTPDARDEIWAYGLRNPFRMSFDAPTGRLWVGDVGQSAQEEINLVQGGGNYGWRLFEGTRNNVNPDGRPFTDFAAPLFTYPHSQGQSITGGVVYRGSELPALSGRYLYGDFVSGRVWALTEAGGAAVENIELGRVPNPSSFALDQDGELLISAFDGHIYRLTAAVGADVGAPPARLSQTGLFSNLATLDAAPDLIAYQPIAPFWSDGTDKRRWLQLPEDERITFSANAPWDFPVGTRTIKHFEIALADGTRKRLETRVFERRDSGWLGYTYRWNAAGTDAELLPGGASEVLTVADGAGSARTQTYHYPDRAQCLQCHTEAAGFVLGIGTAQLNHAGSGGQNQLQAFADAGRFDRAIDAPQTYPALVDPSDASSTLAARARAYLDTNCAQCHRPGGPTPLDMDLRAATPIADTRVLDVPPAGDTFGVANARRIAPGDKTRSLLWTRMNTLDPAARMPPVGSHVIDEAGTALIGAWIDGGL